MMALAHSASAQASDPPTDSEPPAESEGTEEVERPIRWNELTLSLNSRPGNIQLSRYGRPPENLSLHSLRLLKPYSAEQPYFKLVAQGLPERDNHLAGTIVVNKGHTAIRASRTEHGFYKDGFAARDLSLNKQTVISIDQTISQNYKGYLYYQSRDRKSDYTAPRDRDHTNTEVLAAGVGGNVLEGQLDLNITSRRTRDYLGNQPVTVQRRYDATYSRDFGSNFNVEGAIGIGRIEQKGRPASNTQSYAFNGSLTLSPMTTLGLQFGRQELDLNSVQNGYVRQRTVSGARLSHRMNRWNLQAGYKYRELERVNADQTFVDKPRFNEYDARISGKIGQANVVVKGTWEDMRDNVSVQTNDTRQLQWDDRATLQVRAAGSSDLISLYGVYTYRFQQNKQREVEIRWNNFVLGGSYVFGPTLSGFAEFAADDFEAKGDVNGGVALDSYFPSSRSASFGFNWSPSDVLAASASVNLYESADVRGNQVTLSLRRKLAEDHEVELVASPWQRTDRQFGVTGYRATLLSLRYHVKF